MSNTTRSEMIRATQRIVNGVVKGHINLTDSAYIYDEVIALIAKQLVENGGLTLRNFGSFTVREYEGRTAPDPQGRAETVNIPAFKAITFKSSGKLKDLVNGRIDAGADSDED
jgi:nucleoid DNA-binding protein